MIYISLINLPFTFCSICLNIAAASAYGIYISLLIRCGSYQDVIDSVPAIKIATEQMVSSGRVKIFTSKDLRSPSCVPECLCLQMTTDIFLLS